MTPAAQPGAAKRGALRLAVAALLSAGLATGLCLLLARFAGIDLAAFGAILAGTSPAAALGVVALTAFGIALSAEKWRLVNRVLGDAPPSRATAFALTALGVAFAQVLPAQSGPLVARAAASRLFPDAPSLRRGLGATLYESAYDLAVVGLLGFVSAAVLVTGGGGAAWLAGAAAAIAAGWLLAGVPRALIGLAARLPFAGARTARVAADPGLNRLAAPATSRRLYGLSVLRFLLLAAMTVVIAEGAGLAIPAWQLAAALPLPILAVVVAITPAGLGVNEWAMASALAAFGTPLATAVLWTAASRALSAGAALLLGLLALAMAAALRIRRRGFAPPIPRFAPAGRTAS